MLEIDIQVAPEQWNERTQEFVPAKTKTVRMEHSLISMSKWEAKYKRSYIDDGPKNNKEEVLDYYRCMCIDNNDASLINNIDQQNANDIASYIDDPHSATRFSNNGGHGGRSNEGVTSELIYYWMADYGIPFECEKWFLQRLLNLIRICQEKENNSGKKQSAKERAMFDRALNESRRKKLGTRG